jgi:hypothetical protein
MAFSQPALVSTFLSTLTGFLLASANPDNQAVSSFLVTFFLMWIAPPLAWMLAAASVFEKTRFADLRHSNVQLSVWTSFTAMTLPLIGEVVAGIGMGYYMRGLWGLDGIGPPIAATGGIMVFALIWYFIRGARPLAACSVAAAVLLNIGFMVGAQIS